MNSELITQIILGIILIVGAIISGYGVPVLKSLFAWFETKRLYAYMFKAVEWANQTIPKEEWERKRKEVLALCLDFAQKHISIDFTETQIEVIMEALVKQAKMIKDKEE